jgi:hypothetical protein
MALTMISMIFRVSAFEIPMRDEYSLSTTGWGILFKALQRAISSSKLHSMLNSSLFFLDMFISISAAPIDPAVADS